MRVMDLTASDLFHLISGAVFLGGVLAACFVWCFAHLRNYKHEDDAPWLVLAGIAGPAIYALLCFTIVFD